VPTAAGTRKLWSLRSSKVVPKRDLIAEEREKEKKI